MRSPRAQDQEAEGNKEWESGTHPDNSFFLPSVCASLGRILVLFHGRFEATDTITNSFAQFRKLFGTKNKHGDTKNQREMHGLKKSFDHGSSLHFGKKTSHCLRGASRRCARCHVGHSAPSAAINN